MTTNMKKLAVVTLLIKSIGADCFHFGYALGKEHLLRDQKLDRAQRKTKRQNKRVKKS